MVKTLKMYVHFAGYFHCICTNNGEVWTRKSDPGVKLHNIGDVELEDLVGAKGLTKGTLWSVQAIYTNADSKVCKKLCNIVYVQM